MNLYVDGTANGSASVAANGSYSVDRALTNGPHSITAGEVNAAGTETLGVGALDGHCRHYCTCRHGKGTRAELNGGKPDVQCHGDLQ